jgi:ferredoxin-thioredoxin reductase catalytic subunit
MKGYRINKDKKHVDLIIEGLLKKDGYCPCKVEKIPENLCPCDEFITTGVCHCGLWVKEETNE